MPAGSLKSAGNRNPMVRPGNTQDVSVTATAARNATAFTAGIEQIRISCDVPIRYKIGASDVTAGANDIYLPAGVVEFVRINNGVDTHISAIRVGLVNGTMNLAECN